MTTLAKIICVAAVCVISLTGCTNRYQSPYGYNNGLIPPPGTGGYGYNAQAPQPYYQPNQNYQPNQYYQAYQTPPPVGYGQPNVASNVAPYQNWEASGNVNVASTQPSLQPTMQPVQPIMQPEFQVAPASYDEAYPPEAYNQQPMQQDPAFQQQYQPPAQPNFDGFNDQQGSLNQMHINRPDINIDRSQAVMVPLNNPQANQNMVASTNGQSTVRFVPVDPGAIVLPQSNGYQPNYVPAYEPTTSPGTTAGTHVARNSTLANHDPQWQGFR